MIRIHLIRLQVMHLIFGPISILGRVWFGCGHSMTVYSKTTLVAPEEVSVEVAIALLLSELEIISSLGEEQRTALKVFLTGKGFFYSSSDYL